jgi:hypothetical protein
MAQTLMTSSPGTTAVGSTISSSTDSGRRAVRQRSRILTAYQAAAPHTVELVDGRLMSVAPTDWIVSVGSQILSVVSAVEFPRLYEWADERQLVLPADACRQLQDILGAPSLQSPAALVNGIRRLALLRVGEIELSFTPGQLEELARRARKRNRSVEREIKEVVSRIEQELFWGQPSPTEGS